MSIDKHNVTLTEIINEVKQQTGCKVFFNSTLANRHKATVQLQKATVAEILKVALEGTNLTFIEEDGTLIIRRQPDTSHQSPTVKERTVTGRVVDASGTLLSGAVVRVGNSHRGVITDAEGNFTVTVSDDVHALYISFVGMKPQELKLGSQNRYQVVLQEDAVMLGDVVATGYQTISKERATGAYDILKSDDVERRHATKFSSVLDGLVAGAKGADDGRGGMSYQIRGVGTMLADQAPLVVVDGFPLMDIGSSGGDSNPALSALEKINPNDVESITVLKDAAAASIWGARSANGVIVITTKKAGHQKQWQVDVQTQLSVSEKFNAGQMLNLASSADMIAYQRMCFDRGWISDEYSPNVSALYNPITTSALYLYQGLRWGSINEDEMNAQLDRLAQLNLTDQVEEHFFSNPLIFQTNASVQGGTEHYSTRASVLYQHDSGDFVGKQQNSFMASWNNSFNFNRYLSLNVNLHLQQENQHSSLVTETDLRTLSPYEVFLNPDGSYASQVGSYNTDVLNLFDWTRFPNQDVDYNLLQEARTRSLRTTNTSYRAQVGLQVNIMDGLRFQSQFQYEENRYKRRAYHGTESFYARFQPNYYTPCDFEGVPYEASAIPAGGIRQESEGKRTGIVFRNDLTFDRTFNEVHALSVVVGNELSNYRTHNYSLPYLYGCTSVTEGGTLAPTGEVGTISGYTTTVSGAPIAGKDYLTETRNYNRYVSFYGNASYMYDNRYGLSMSARSDASNLITSKPRYRWSPLWSVGLMWNVAQETFMQSALWVDRLTLRATYGQNGNACSSSSARTTINTDSSNPDESTGLYPGNISDYGNPTLRWEKTATTNIGIDFSLFHHHLFGSIDYYNKRGTDILGSVSISGVNGTQYATFNNAEMQNRGVEVSLGAQFEASGIRFGADVTYAYNKNKVVSLYREINNVSDMLSAYTVAGYPLNPIFAFEYKGLNEAGIPTISDGHGGVYPIDDYNIYSYTDYSCVKYLGSRVSPHTLGVTLHAAWKGFALSALFNGRFGGMMQMPTFTYPSISSWGKMTLNAQLGDVLAGDASMLPLPGEAVDPYAYNYWSYYSNSLDHRYEDASYVYCKEVVLDYTFPQFTPASPLIKGLGFFAKVENLGLVWTANSKGYHPDYLPGTTAAPARTYMVGARLSF